MGGTLPNWETDIAIALLVGTAFFVVVSAIAFVVNILTGNGWFYGL